MKSIVIIGPRGSGKSSVASNLAERLKLPFADADEEFVKQCGEITPFYEKHGWPKFRAHESAVIYGICKIDYPDIRIVLAAGSGAVAHQDADLLRTRNTALLREYGRLFYLLPDENLEKSAVTLTERIAKDPKSASSRPPLPQDMLATLQERHPFYLSAAHGTIYTGTKSVEEVAQEIFDSKLIQS